MEYISFVRKPFVIEAVEITRDNIEELAPLIGELRRKDDGAPYIRVNPDLVPNVFDVYPGYWMTKLNNAIRCYSRRVFHEQFIQNTVEINDWVQFLNGEPEPAYSAQQERSPETKVIPQSVAQDSN